MSLKSGTVLIFDGDASVREGVQAHRVCLLLDLRMVKVGVKNVTQSVRLDQQQRFQPPGPALRPPAQATSKPLLPSGAIHHACGGRLLIRDCAN
ncbi:MAG: hypothetical protein ACO24A_00495 [Burkholderiaceae bacterium]|jgi:hypothetical protein